MIVPDPSIFELSTSPPGRRRATPAAGSGLQRLLDGPVRPGRVVSLWLRPGRHAAMAAVDQARLDPADGVAGDHYAGRSGTRQVSLIGAEQLAAIGGFLGIGAASPAQLRRNVVTAGINLLALKGRRFRLGSALLEFTEECHPCSRMEVTLGPGGYNAVRGQGGILARVLEGAMLHVGDKVERLLP